MPRNEIQPQKAVWILGSIAFFVCLVFGKDIDLSKQRPLYEGLLTVSAIIFAVIGAWITIIFPRAVDKVVKQKQSLSESEVRNLDLMVLNIKISTGVIIAVMSAGIIEQMLKVFEWHALIIITFRSLSFGLLGFATVAQFMTLFLTLYHTLDAHERLKQQSKVNDRLKSLNEFNQIDHKD